MVRRPIPFHWCHVCTSQCTMSFNTTSKTRLCQVPCLTTRFAHWPFDADAVLHRPAVRPQHAHGKTLLGALTCPPWHGSSPALFVCGGAQRGISLATGTFTGESRRKPPATRFWKKRLIIKGLRNHDFGALDSFAESRESSLRKPPCQKPASGSHLSEAIESACIFRLTKLPPLTYPLIIEE